VSKLVCHRLYIYLAKTVIFDIPGVWGRYGEASSNASQLQHLQPVQSGSGCLNIMFGQGNSGTELAQLKQSDSSLAQWKLIVDVLKVL
jgi:hypothetical protein